MKLKPMGGYDAVEGRIDGVMYGQTRYGTVGAYWPYPLNSPSFSFVTANDSIRGLDQNWQYVADDKRSEWERFVDESTARELCLLWYLFGSARSPDEAAKSAYVNVNTWRPMLGRAQSDMPPIDDILPAGDSVSIVENYPFIAHWSRDGVNPSVPMYLAIWGRVSSTRPAKPVTHRKMKFLTLTGFTPNEDMNLQPVIDQFLPHFHGAFLSLSLAAGVTGSAPYVALQTGTYSQMEP